MCVRPSPRRSDKSVSTALEAALPTSVEEGSGVISVMCLALSSSVARCPRVVPSRFQGNKILGLCTDRRRVQFDKSSHHGEDYVYYQSVHEKFAHSQLRSILLHCL